MNIDFVKTPFTNNPSMTRLGGGSVFNQNPEERYLAEVWDTRILESINSMTEEVLNYKSLKQIKEILNRMEV